MSKEQFKDKNFLIAKSLHHVSIAKQYFESVALDYKQGAKQLMNLYASKMDYLIKDITDRLNDESRKHFNDALIKGDTLFYDDIGTKLMHLNEKQREVIQAIVDGMLEGEEILFEKTN